LTLIFYPGLLGRGAVFKPAGSGRSLRGRAVSHDFGGYSEGETPLPIPNRAVKPLSADGTWDSRPWESRSPPCYLDEEPPSGRLFVVLGRLGPGRLARIALPGPGRGRGLAAVASSAASPRERLPSGHMTGPLTTGPIRGQRLEAVFAQRGEVDREVDGAEHPLGNAVRLDRLHAGQTRFGPGQNVCSATLLARDRRRRCKSAPSAEAVGARGNRR
jgi:hypothetical protein